MRKPSAATCMEQVSVLISIAAVGRMSRRGLHEKAATDWKISLFCSSTASSVRLKAAIIFFSYIAFKSLAAALALLYFSYSWGVRQPTNPWADKYTWSSLVLPCEHVHSMESLIGNRVLPLELSGSRYSCQRHPRLLSLLCCTLLCPPPLLNKH